MKIKILPYKSFSQSARDLVRVLGNKAIVKSQTTPMYGRKKVLINWGHSSPRFNLTNVSVLNKPQAVSNAIDKFLSLQIMKDAGVNTPEFTKDIEVAKEWIEDNRIVFCRKLLKANSGRGIVVAKTVDELIPALLYVKYIRKEREYRVHVFNGNVIDVVEKRRRSGFDSNPAYNKYIRSYEQGWIFARDGISVTNATEQEAIKAVQSLGLDFGAVDIVINRDDIPVVLECNTAPGLMGTTLDKYKAAVQAWVETL
jgi:glutathione synthase/RimK-type ligase-like ATP-grasp enzyme